MEKKMWVAALVAVLASSTLALGLAPMGPPRASLNQGQSSAALDYSYSEMDLEFSGFGTTATEEVETNMLFANLGYGITEQCEGFARLGVATIEVEDFDSGSEFAYGLGTKLTLAEQDAVTWGALFQIGWFEGDDSIAGVDVEIDAYEIQIAAGLTYEAENMRIYGGPFLHFVDGDGNAEILGYSGSFDVEQESVFGGYIGAQMDTAKNSFLNVEAQFTGDAWALGFGIGGRF